MRKEAVVVLSKAPSRHLSRGTEENRENLSKGSRSPGRNSNTEPLEYETGVLATRPRRLIDSELCAVTS
jgi:hypothetical protein